MIPTPIIMIILIGGLVLLAVILSWCCSDETGKLSNNRQLMERAKVITRI